MSTELKFPPAVSAIDLPLSDTCNLRCAFCYTHGGCGKPYNEQHVNAVFDWAFKQFEPATPEQKKYGLKFSIYGGEPLVEYAHIQELVPKYRRIAQERGTSARFGIVTNVTLLDEAKLNWLLENRVSISCSIDGCAKAQDTFRVYANGKGSSEQAFANVRRYIGRLPNRSCRMTIAPATAPYLFESVKFVTEDLGFTTANAILAGGVPWSDADLDVVRDQITQVTDWWIDNMRRGKHYSLYHIRNMVGKIWNPRRATTLCGAGRSMVGVDTAGNIWPCHRFCNPASDPAYRLGTIETGITNRALYEKIMQYNLATSLKEHCKSCPAVIGCHALCHHEIMAAGQPMFTPLDHYCKIWPFYWQQAMKAHAILTAERNELYLKTYDPARQQPRPVPNQQRPQQRPPPPMPRAPVQRALPR